VAGVIVGKQGANLKEIIRVIAGEGNSTNGIILRAKEDMSDSDIRWIHVAAMQDKIVTVVTELSDIVRQAY